MLNKDISELKAVQSGIKSGLALCTGDGIGEAVGANATVVSSLKQRFAELNKAFDQRIETGKQQIGRYQSLHTHNMIITAGRWQACREAEKHCRGHAQ